MPLNNPLPKSLRHECEKAARILNNFTIPSAERGPDSLIPSRIITGAKGLAILTVFKAGFLVSIRAGSGIVIAKLSDGSWSAPAAIGVAGLGGGFEIGAEVICFICNCKNAVIISCTQCNLLAHRFCNCAEQSRSC
jgi:lipid-binding SYLF domain-containing protein